MNKLKYLPQIILNMGWRYVFYRIGFEFKRRSGLLKKDFPVNVTPKSWVSLDQWKQETESFFFESRELLTFEKNQSIALKAKFNKIEKGIFTFFSSIDFDLGTNYDWLTNPESGYKYKLNHWTEIPDFSSETGDIKFLWEKSRFSHLYTIIRYDYHFQDDQSKFVFSEILSWIKSNPVNQGPNWRCSQEISLRVLNWTFALNYYKNSENLNEKDFDVIIDSIYWQMKHVYANINFSRIAVRNNHAITETLSLYLIGLLYPFFPESQKWKKDGKKWFEEEIEYQIYEDGTFLQFSMNYHRVVIQLLTWAFYLSEKNNEKFSDVVYERASKSLEFLMICQDDYSGFLPNYGANDGALFFPLNEEDYRNYRPQLNALYYYFNKKVYNDKIEDLAWFGQNNITTHKKEFKGTFSFDIGGYYIHKDQNSLSFIRCGNHKDRPSQADNLHFDLWFKGENILIDAGSYKYNTDSATLSQFIGTAAHNTVSLGNHDQMLKGPRFIWFDWTQAKNTSWQDTIDSIVFQGKIQAFKHLSKKIYHTRTIKILKESNTWHIEDEISENSDFLMTQNWHLPLKTVSQVSLTSTIEPNEIIGLHSSYYGKKENCRHLQFSQKANTIKTIIQISA